jgi:ethanolamine utilization protein EutN
MYLARIDGVVTSTVKHPSLEGRRLLIGQRVEPGGAEVGDPQILLDPIGVRVGSRVLVTTDGEFTRRWLGDDRTPTRLSVLAVVDEVQEQESSGSGWISR